MTAKGLQRTLSMIKPDGVGSRLIGEVLRRFEQEGFRIIGLKLVRLTPDDARAFYSVHRERPFFDSLCAFMTSGPIVAVALEGEEVIDRLRAVMGATNPAEAAEGTIRKAHASSIEKNVVHGSDSESTAAIEIPFFFSQRELCGGGG